MRPYKARRTPARTMFVAPRTVAPSIVRLAICPPPVFLPCSRPRPCVRWNHLVAIEPSSTSLQGLHSSIRGGPTATRELRRQLAPDGRSRRTSGADGDEDGSCG